MWQYVKVIGIYIIYINDRIYGKTYIKYVCMSSTDDRGCGVRTTGEESPGFTGQGAG